MNATSEKTHLYSKVLWAALKDLHVPFDGKQDWKARKKAVIAVLKALSCEHFRDETAAARAWQVVFDRLVCWKGLRHDELSRFLEDCPVTQQRNDLAQAYLDMTVKRLLGIRERFAGSDGSDEEKADFRKQEDGILFSLMRVLRQIPDKVEPDTWTAMLDMFAGLVVDTDPVIGTSNGALEASAGFLRRYASEGAFQAFVGRFLVTRSGYVEKVFDARLGITDELYFVLWQMIRVDTDAAESYMLGLKDLVFRKGLPGPIHRHYDHDTRKPARMTYKPWETPQALVLIGWTVADEDDFSIVLSKDGERVTKRKLLTLPSRNQKAA